VKLVVTLRDAASALRSGTELEYAGIHHRELLAQAFADIPHGVSIAALRLDRELDRSERCEATVPGSRSEGPVTRQRPLRPLD
jgi:hypothetical protein